MVQVTQSKPRASNWMLVWSMFLFATILVSLPFSIAASAKENNPVLIYAVYPTTHGASDTFEIIGKAHREGLAKIDAFAVVSKNVDGWVSVRTTQQNDAFWGSVLGGLIGVIGGPAGVAAGAAGGGLTGWLIGERVGVPAAAIRQMRKSLVRGSSAMIVVVEEGPVAKMLMRELDRNETKKVQKMPIEKKG